nr:hypothetical protein [Streptomyces sp. alain-838]
MRGAAGSGGRTGPPAPGRTSPCCGGGCGPATWAAGAVLLAGLLLFAADLALAGAGLPGARLFAGAAVVIGAGAVLVGLRACARPESLSDWPAAVRAAAGDSVRDAGGSTLVLLAVATAALCAWMLVPLAFLAPGPLALALTAVDVRRTHGS